MPDEMPLPGNATSTLVRVGDTVRRPVGPWTDSVDALLMHLQVVGFEGAPRPLGRDDQGRQVVEFIPGDAGDEAGTYSLADLAAIGRLLRDYHDAVASFVPPPSSVWNVLIPDPDVHRGPDGDQLICHNDAAPWNLIRSTRRWVLIDWDVAAPASRLWELAYSAQSMAGLSSARPPREAAARLRAFVDSYGLDGARRPDLAVTLGRRARAMYEFLRAGAREQRQPWTRIWREDGPYWRAVADYLDTHVELWSAALE